MCTYKSLTTEEAHKTNQFHEEQIKNKEKICQSYHFDNKLLLLDFHCSHLDEDLLYFQVYNEWLLLIHIKELLFPQWVKYIMNRSNLQHEHSKFHYGCAEFFPGCLKHTVHLHSKFTFVYPCIPELGFENRLIVWAVWYHSPEYENSIITQ